MSSPCWRRRQTEKILDCPLHLCWLLGDSVNNSDDYFELNNHFNDHFADHFN